MPRVESWDEPMKGLHVRRITVTTSRAEIVQRIKAVPTFRHKRLIAKAWRRDNATL